MSDDFPYIKVDQRIQFPGEDDIDESGIVGVGGNLSPGMILSAYEQGVFPWYSSDEPIIWWNPAERAVLLPGKLHISQSMKRFLKKTNFTVTFDQAFSAVIRSCREIERPGQDGTWITDEMLEAYCELHRLGYAHSVEVWDTGCSIENPAGEPADESKGTPLGEPAGEPIGTPIGGLYGLQAGTAFFGESMFSLVPNASKMALIFLYRHLMSLGMSMIDCQVMNDHLASFGAITISRSEYMQLLQNSLNN